MKRVFWALVLIHLCVGFAQTLALAAQMVTHRTQETVVSPSSTLYSSGDVSAQSEAVRSQCPDLPWQRAVTLLAVGAFGMCASFWARRRWWMAPAFVVGLAAMLILGDMIRVPGTHRLWPAELALVGVVGAAGYWTVGRIRKMFKREHL